MLVVKFAIRNSQFAFLERVFNANQIPKSAATVFFVLCASGRLMAFLRVIRFQRFGRFRKWRFVVQFCVFIFSVVS